MARSRRGGGMMGGTRRAAKTRPMPARSVPAPTQSRPPAPMQQQQQSGGMLSGIGSTIAQGMAFGTGSAIAHRTVGAVAGSMSGGGGDGGQPVAEAPAMAQQGAPLEGPCAQDKQMFFECLQVNKGDQQSCSFLYDNLQTCQRNQTSMQFQ